jgi:lipoprotein-releasing system ATP-binding protein
VEQVAIRTEGLTKTYQSGANDLTVFANLNFSVAQGERVALTGASGAGKSSLLHCIGGLDRPSKGKIFCGDRDLQTLTEKELAEFRNREVGFVWQIHYLLPEFSAEENVMMPLLIRGVPHAEASREALARLDEVGLRARAHHRAGELSGGEQQRVVLARALVGRPKFLLADEPTGNLDERTGEKIGELLRDLHRTHGLTSVYVTHNPIFARSCDRVLCLQNGELAHV